MDSKHLSINFMHLSVCQLCFHCFFDYRKTVEQFICCKELAKIMTSQNDFNTMDSSLETLHLICESLLHT